MVFTANAGLVNRRKGSDYFAFRHPERQGVTALQKFFQDK
jgi:hypothetical protein